jgi:ABC-type sugar transport system permease subunit
MVEKKRIPSVRIQEIWPLFPAGIYLLGFFIIVLVYLLVLSFSHGIGSEQAFPTFRTIHDTISTNAFWDALVNTLVFTIIGTPLELVVGLALALVVYRNFKLRSLTRSIFLIPLAIPALVTAIMLYILFDFPGGHVNHLLMGKYPLFPAIIHDPISWRGTKLLALGMSLLGKVWRDMPISMLIILAGLNSIDIELFDAAKTMGAGWRQQLGKVILPLIIPSLSAVVLLRSIEMWKEFIFPFVLAGRYNLLGTLIEQFYSNWGNANEAAVVALVLVFCIVLTTLALLGMAEFYKRLTTIHKGL